MHWISLTTISNTPPPTTWVNQSRFDTYTSVEADKWRSSGQTWNYRGITQWLPTSIILLLAVHVFCMDCTLSVAMACRLLLCTLCSTALAKVIYASPAWWGFTYAADRNRLEAFIRRVVRHGYCTHTTPTPSISQKRQIRHMEHTFVQ